MLEETIEDIFTEGEVVLSISGTIFRQAPNYAPRNIQTIVNKSLEIMRSDSFKERTKSRLLADPVYCTNIGLDTYIETLVTELEETCQEYKDLNLRQVEVDAGIKVDDPYRGIGIVTAFDQNQHGEYSFIDLDALKRNIIALFLMVNTCEV